MDKPSLSESALRRIKAVQLEAGADLLNGLDAFWRGIGMSTKALREQDPSELMPLFERYAEKLFDAEAGELLACCSDPDAYTKEVIFLPLAVATRICPAVDTIPELFPSTDWKDLYRALKARSAESGMQNFLGQLMPLSGVWENYLDHSFSRRFLKGRITTLSPDIDGAVKNFRALFWMKYLFHLRLLANKQLFIQRLRTHLSVQLQVWRAQAYRQLADAVAPPTDEGLPALPQATTPVIPCDEAAAPGAPRKRGPKPDHDTAARIAEVVARIASNGDWRSKLDEICDALDEEHIPVPRTWRRNRKCTQWSLCDDRDLIVKAIDYRLRQRKKDSPETFS
ncbi:MAG: hypothetical protein M1541_14815 [Acidobacteria bacterium]|nr:hypothetical protein [Acidobacteriota bacterium]